MIEVGFDDRQFRERHREAWIDRHGLFEQRQRLQLPIPLVKVDAVRVVAIRLHRCGRHFLQVAIERRAGRRGDRHRRLQQRARRITARQRELCPDALVRSSTIGNRLLSPIASTRSEVTILPLATSCSVVLMRIVSPDFM